MSTRRKSTVSVPRGTRLLEELPALELERLEQETTLILQEIDKNLSHANAVINDKMIPILRRYAAATGQVWTNVGFWKHFLEEAADVEISTVNDPLETTKEELHADATHQDAQKIRGDVSTSPEPQIEALTPQLRSRPLLLSNHLDVSPQVVAMRKTATGYLKVAVSPRKRTPKRTPNRDILTPAEKRLSMIENFLNSSPTLPEPPILLSEVGRTGQASSSSANRPNLGVRPHLLSDSDDRNLGALLPIRFPSASLTPAVSTGTRTSAGHNARLSSGSRFPRTPTFASLHSKRSSVISPVRRTPIPRREALEDELDLQVPKPSTALGNSDESDDLPLPDLQTIQVTGLKQSVGDVLTPKPPTPGSGQSSAKRRRLTNDDAENVFLDTTAHGSRNNSTVYHTIVHETEKETRTSRSMSQIFDEVLNESGRDKETDEREILSGSGNEDEIQDSGDKQNAQNDIATIGVIPHLQPADFDCETPILPPQIGNDSTQNLSQNLDEPTGNSSELGSFLGQRWKSLAKSIRKK